MRAPKHGAVLGWLPWAVPADGLRLRVADPALARLLAEEGAQLVETDPHAEIAPLHALSGEGALAVAVWVGGPRVAGRGLLGRTALAQALPLRALQRLLAALRARVWARAARRRLRALGHTEVHVVLWDDQVPPVFGDGARMPLRRRAVGMLPECALAVGRRRPDAQTVLERVLSAVRDDVGRCADPMHVAVRAEMLLAETDAGILRVAIGSGRRLVVAERRALTWLALARPPSLVRVRVPQELASGTTGIAAWLLETSLPGKAARRPVEGLLLEDCVHFLGALHGLGCAPRVAPTLVAEAHAVARACTAQAGQAVIELSTRAEEALAELPRGFGHGDFFHGNLLAADGRLTGVVDWESAGPGRLPFVDLLHLRLSSMAEPSEQTWGALVLDRLLPWASEGGDESLAEYGRRIGRRASAAELRWLVFAYWLGYVSQQLRSHPHRRTQPDWLELNIEQAWPRFRQALGAPTSARSRRWAAVG